MSISKSNKGSSESVHDIEEEEEVPEYLPYTPPKPQQRTCTQQLEHISTAVKKSCRFDKREQQKFIDSLPTQTQIILNQSFGKPNLSQCFALVPNVCHVLLPIINGGWLSTTDKNALRATCNNFRNLFHAIQEYELLDFTSLKDPPPLTWDDEKDLNLERLSKVSAALLRYNGNLATVVRYIGGVHVGAHRNNQANLSAIKGKISEQAYKDVKRVWTMGVPAYLNAESTQRNFQAFQQYGNHKSVSERPEASLKAFIKDHRRGFNLAIDPRLLPFILHAHLSPQGLVVKEGKSDRPVFDCSFRPQPWCNAINDWTNKENEPALEFPDAFPTFLTHVYNLRITYPNERIFIGDDDVSGAFRHSKSHPDLVAMNLAQLSCNGKDYLFAATGQNFGGTTTPQNWEPNAIARKQMAQYFWKENSPETIAMVAPLIPSLTIAPATKNAIPIMSAHCDDINKGLTDETPPPYATHVDDCMYAFIEKDLQRTVCSSIRGLYQILGQPDPRYLNPLSLEKLESEYSEQRRTVGWWINSRSLTVSVPTDRRNDVLATMEKWLTAKSFSMIEAATLHGKLESIFRFHRWGRAQFFVLRANFRHVIQQRYHAVIRRDPKFKEKARQRYAAILPQAQRERMENLVSRDLAAVIWNTREKTSITKELRQEITYLHQFLKDFNNELSTPIGHIIPRASNFETFGDACLTGGGAVCHDLQIWFAVPWDTAVQKMVQSSKTTFGINELEFIVVILQFVACKLAISDPTQYPNIHIPEEPIFNIWCDNTSSQSWVNRATAKSLHASNLVKLFAELTNDSPIGLGSDRISSSDNYEADFLSRIDCRFSHTARCQTAYHTLPTLTTYRCFRPSSHLLESLYSALSSTALIQRPVLPKKLGHFEAASYSS